MMLKSVVVASALVATAYAQATTASIASIASQVMPPIATQGFDISQVDDTDKRNWCEAQRHTCVDMCLDHTQQNDCIDDTLTYTCVCYNGTEPDSTSFMETIPFHECQATHDQCIAAHENDSEAQGICNMNEQCPTRNATAEKLAAEGSSSSSSSSGTASATGSQSTSASASGASSTSSQAAGASVTPASTGAFVALLFAVCKLVL